MLTLVAVLALTTGPCDLVDKAAATSLLGAPVTAVTPSGPAPDEDTGGTMSSCVYQAGERMLVVVRVDYPTAAAANDAANAEMSPEKLAEEGTTATPESGLGDKAWLSHTRSGLQYSVLKGASALALAIGGMPKDLATYESQLRAATAAAVKKL
jgi:hypothetical protein